MTIIVWDGKVLATDTAATDGAAQWEVEKAWKFKGVILSGAGPLQSILAMREWYKEGAFPNKFPSVQLTTQFCHFVVVDSDGLHRYEQGPIPIEHGKLKCAFGEGKDFAYGALAMGADAGTAVQIAIDHSVHCGLSVKLYKL